ncbi:ferredoxin:glutaredoxin reductase [candidate division FCPU426 bacterium]|nr:ferredoxin:glutaredoxin reductase [candidate division FCPU426 bacterium]
MPPSKQAIEDLRKIISKRRGYYLNPDAEMTDALLESLLVNEERYGYAFCPCRLAAEVYEKDRDLICPCDYRDQDVNEYGTCYCGLYVSQKIYKNKGQITPIPERRDMPPSPNKIWRCTVCGYLCARPSPPDVCPVCGVTHDRFEEFHF